MKLKRTFAIIAFVVTAALAYGQISPGGSIVQYVVWALGYKSTNNTTAYGATTTFDARQSLQTVTLAGNVTFATSNRESGRFVTVRVICDGSNRTLTFPAWKFTGTVAPATMTASKTALLTLVFFGTAETDVVASWVVEP